MVYDPKRERNVSPHITFAELATAYKNFCVAAKDPIFRTEVFRGWGKPGKVAFKREGWQEFEGV